MELLLDVVFEGGAEPELGCNVLGPLGAVGIGCGGC